MKNELDINEKEALFSTSSNKIKFRKFYFLETEFRMRLKVSGLIPKKDAIIA